MDGLALARWRLRSLRLDGPGLATPAAVVRHLGAVQSQEYGPACWSVGQRTAGGTGAVVEQAVAVGDILRTHVLRPTWHFVAPEDLRWLLELTAPRVRRALGYADVELDRDRAVLARAAGRLIADLRGRTALTRPQIGAVLATDGRRLAHLLMHLELDALICSGPPRGKAQTYMLVEERVPAAPALSRDEALAELTTRYFTSHGPSSAKDFGWWASLSVADVRRGIELAQLESIVADGTTYWFGEVPPARRSRVRAAHLLPAFDEAVVGYTATRQLVDLGGRAPAPRGGMYPSLLLLDGQVAGHWRRVIAKNTVRVEVVGCGPLDDVDVRAVRASVDAYANFLGLRAELSIA